MKNYLYLIACLMFSTSGGMSIAIFDDIAIDKTLAGGMIGFVFGAAIVMAALFIVSALDRATGPISDNIC